MTNFKLKGIGLDTTTLDYSPVKYYYDKASIGYVLTNPAANNDFLIKPYLEYLSEAFLLTEINYVDGADDILVSYLKHLGRTKYDLLFLNANLDYKYFDTSIKDIYSRNEIEHLGLSRPKDIDTLKKNIEYLEAIGHKVESVLLDISPINFQKDIIDYCIEAGITIFSTNTFGGWVNSNAVISTYTTPYLLEFSSLYSDVIILSSRDMCNVKYNIPFLEQLMKSEDIYLEPLDIPCPITPVQKPTPIIFTALKLEGDKIIPYNTPNYVFQPDQLILGQTDIFPEIKLGRDKTETEIGVEKLIPLVYKTPELSDDDYFVSLRFKIEDFLEISHKGWEKEILKITDKIIYLKYTKETFRIRWFGKSTKIKEKSNEYLLYYAEGIFGFVEILEKGS